VNFADAKQIVRIMAEGSEKVEKLGPETLRNIAYLVSKIDLTADEAKAIVTKRVVSLRASDRWPHAGDFLDELRVKAREKHGIGMPVRFGPQVPAVEVGERPGEQNPSKTILPPNAWPIKAIREAKGDKDKAIAACPMLGRPHPRGGRMIDMAIFDDECREARGERRAHLPGPREASELREQAERMRRAVDAAAETDDWTATVEAVGGHNE